MKRNRRLAFWTAAWALLAARGAAAQTPPTLAWVHRSVGGFSTLTESTAVAANGERACAASRFQGAVDFDDGPGTALLTSGQGFNTAVSCYSEQGALLWARGFLGLLAEPADIAVARGGEVVVVGQYAGVVDFDPGPGVFALTSPGGSFDGFVAKLSRDGDLLWAKQFFTSGTRASAVAIAASSEIWVAGRPSFNRGLTRYSSAGAVVSSHVVEFEAFDLAASPDGTVYLAGRFVGAADFDLGPGVVHLPWRGKEDAFVARFDQDLGLRWAVSAGGPGADIAFGLATAPDGLVATGNYQVDADFDPDPVAEEILSAVGRDAFVWRLSSEGTLRWARGLGGDADDSGSGVSVARLGHVFATGSFRGEMDADPGTGEHLLTPSGGAGDFDGFLVELDADGQFVRAGQVGGASLDLLSDTAAFADQIVFTGFFGNGADLDPTGGEALASTLAFDELLVGSLAVPVGTLEVPALAPSGLLLLAATLAALSLARLRR